MKTSEIKKRRATATEERRLTANAFIVAPGVWRLKDIFVNVFIIQDIDSPDWVLVDAGLKTTGARLKKLVAELFGSAGSVPKAIVLTHAHFDHRGSLEDLANEWSVPVYCHHQELPYLQGQASYPPADPSVGGGMMATLSFVYPKKPINFSGDLQELPEDGTIPGLKDWKWMHTPGHTPGHISLFRDADGVLIAGDAITTTLAESALSTATQAKILSGPPKYFTPDWGAAARTVRELAQLKPAVIATGHGQTLYGKEQAQALNHLARSFWQKGMPAKGRYVKEPALFDEHGVATYVPPPRGYFAARLITAAALLTIGYLLYRKGKKGNFIERKASEKLGRTLMGGSLQALGASAPATAALPALPVIPAL